jgi:hypothetical protein
MQDRNKTRGQGRFRNAFLASAPLALLLVACAARPERPTSDASRTYPGTCTLVDIEEVAAPADDPTDTIALVARYRFGAGSEARGPFGLRFEVARARAHDLRQHLAAHPTVVCRSDMSAAAVPPAIELEPFEGQAGRPAP